MPDFEDMEGMESYQQEDYAEQAYEKADNDRKAMKESGEWFRYQRSGLSLSEFRRRELEDEARAAGVDDGY